MQYKKSIMFYYKKTFGIHTSTALKMCQKINVSPFKPYRRINVIKRDKGFSFLNKINYKTGFFLKNIQLKALIYYNKIRNNKGIKFAVGLPVNGQRNKTNAKTAKKQSKLFKQLIIDYKSSNISKRK
jgi:ribosomal protein S13